MRLFILCIFIGISLHAKSEKNCYTVQLISANNSEKNHKHLVQTRFDDSCKLMRIEKKLTVRCGCFEAFKEAQKTLKNFKNDYPDAYIVTTNRSRFNEMQVKANYEKPLQMQDDFENSEEELKLMLQAFLFSNDLENGYRTAKIGYLKHPNSYYWNQKMAEISRWTGRGEEAITHMRFLYKKRGDKKLEKEIIDYGLSAYQYEDIEKIVVKRAVENPTKLNIDMMIYIHTQVGFPEKSAKILEKVYKKDESKEELLSNILRIYLESGDLDSAKKVVSIIEEKKSYSTENVELVSRFYYLRNEMKLAYETLLLAQSDEYSTNYYELVSDLGWYNKEYEIAASASNRLIDRGQARLVDYERVIFVNKNKNFEIGLQKSLEAYEKYKLSYLFYNFANESIKHKRFSQLKRVVLKIQESESSIKDEVNYLFIKAILYKNLGDIDKAGEAIQMALLQDTNNLQTQITALYLYSDFHLYSELTSILQLLSENPRLSESYYFPLASVYFSISDVNRASYFVDKLLQKNAVVANSIDFKFLEANIFNLKNNNDAFIQKLKEIITVLKKEASANPAVVRTDKYLNNLLQAQMYTLNSDEFERKLFSSKVYLTAEHYDDLSYAWARRNSADEKAHEIYSNTKNKALWLTFANAIMLEKHSETEDLLYKYLYLLALGDASEGAYKDGQVALAQTLAYESLYKNDDNQYAYLQHRDLSGERSDIFDAKISNYNRTPVLRKSLMIENKNYLNDGLYLLSGVNYYLNSTLDEAELINIPKDTLELNLGIRNQFERGFVELDAGIISSMRTYPYFSLSGLYRLNHYFSVNASLNKNINTDESVQLLLGGRKEMFSFGVKWDILNSTSLEMRYEKSNFSSQDDIMIGSGDYGLVSLGHQIRNGYPDMYISTFMDYGAYSEKDGYKGVVNDLQPNPFIVLPQDFYNVGLNFSYGMQNSRLYTRVWRPYFETSTYYSSEQDSLAYGLNAGYGGKVWSQDHMSINASYSESVNGVAGTVFELFIRYQFLYTHR